MSSNPPRDHWVLAVGETGGVAVRPSFSGTAAECIHYAKTNVGKWKVLTPSGFNMTNINTTKVPSK